MEPAVTEPPCGKTTKVMRLSAVAKATKMAISASTLVEMVFLLVKKFLILVKNVFLLGLVIVFSLRQYYLVQVPWVDDN